MPRLRIGVVLFNLGSTQGMTETSETREAESLSKKGMPPACPGEPHVGCYQKGTTALADATALCGGVSRFLLFAQPVSLSFSKIT